MSSGLGLVHETALRMMHFIIEMRLVVYYISSYVTKHYAELTNHEVLTVRASYLSLSYLKELLK